LAIGLSAGVGCYLAVTKLKNAFGYDDSLDVFGVHCVGSTIGMLSLGVLADPSVNPLIASTFKVHGATISLAGGLSQVLRQLLGVAVAIGLSGAVSYLMLKFTDRIIGLRVSEDDETVGLDLSQHGEKAYND
jgi:Amt family ammonium transporter